MQPELTRRNFLKTTAAASAAIATAPAFGLDAADPAPREVTLALVGCAHIHTPGFVKSLKAMPAVEVKGVWDHDTARADKWASELEAKTVGDLGEIWSDAEIQAVIICSETNRHRHLVLAAAKAHKHMFVEKPLGINAAESQQMAEAIQNAGLLFSTGYFMRSDPKHIFLKEQIQKGSFGKITRIASWNCHNGALGGWFDKEWRWMADPKQAGVGAFGDLGTHSLDLMMWVLGDVDCVTADIYVVTGRYGECDESGQVLIKFKNGVSGLLVAGWVDVANPVTLQIAGTEGHAVVFNGALYFRSKHVEGADGKDPWKNLPPGLPSPLTMFVEAVRGKANLPLVTPKEAASRVAVMEAMYASAKSRQWTTPA